MQRIPWPRLPALRRLVLTDATILGNHGLAVVSIQSIIDASPSLEDFRLNGFDFSTTTNFVLPPTVKHVHFHECHLVPSPLSAFLSPCIDSLEELGLGIYYYGREDNRSLADFKSISFLQISWEFLSTGNMQFLEYMLPRLRILEVTPLSKTTSNFKESPQQLTETADIFTTLLQANAAHLRLESLTVRGNPSTDGVRLSELVQSILTLRTVGVSIDLVYMHSFLTFVPISLSHLELYLGGTEMEVREFLWNVLPAAYPSLQHLESIRTVEIPPRKPSEVHWQELSRSEIFSRFLALSRNSHMITCTVEDASDSWTTLTEWVAPAEQLNTARYVVDVLLHIVLRPGYRFVDNASPGLDGLLAIAWIVLLSPFLVAAVFVGWIIRLFTLIEDKMARRRGRA